MVRPMDTCQVLKKNPTMITVFLQIEQLYQIYVSFNLTHVPFCFLQYESLNSNSIESLFAGLGFWFSTKRSWKHICSPCSSIWKSNTRWPYKFLNIQLLFCFLLFTWYLFFLNVRSCSYEEVVKTPQKQMLVCWVSQSRCHRYGTWIQQSLGH